MIDNSHRGLFFVATALMCAVAFYGSELARPDPDEFTTTTSSGPRQLTLPPGFKADVASEQSETVPIGVRPTPCAETRPAIPTGNCAPNTLDITPRPSFAATPKPDESAARGELGSEISVGSAVR